MENLKIFTYRYMWTVGDDKKINFKIVTDTEKGIQLFEDNLLKFADIKNVAREYIHEYDVSRIGVFEPILNSSEVE